MAIYEYIDDLEALAGEIQPDSILSRTLFKNEDVKAVLFAFDQGQALSEHTAAQPAIVHIVRGSATVTVGDDTRQAGPGTMIYMRPQLKHSVQADTPLVMLLLLLQKARPE